ncbi:AAA family ATPase [Pseudonocardia petroleophila]|uniref:AAA family ATPase n=1 Tax=Pseudonocardia petroleophila TaxID=37331 RepID=A0A7G7MQ37_9PSEU|nr:LuxR family transcriptional regulator [Pseudonocardia petroleophila]QNG54898.1 AAA family ATPase [Pseudonocardia petroleophila]
MEPRFVGRAAELDELVAALDGALDGRAAAVLLVGEPGIGKSRLAAELGRLAGARAVPVLWGGCTDVPGAPAFWPWRRVLRSWPGDLPAGVAPVAAGVAVDGAGDRFALADAVTGFLRDAASDTGLVVVLDDLQWADPASVALLAHVVREAADARLLVVGTCRAGGAPAGLPGARLVLRGLTPDEVGCALPGVPAGRAAAIADRAGGNPFLVGELVRAWRAGTPDDAVPAGVRDVVRARLDRLPRTCRDLLAPAAVLGREIDLDLLGGVAGLPPDRVLDDLAPAVADGVLERPRGRTSLRFSHDLVREAVPADDDAGRVHARAAAVLAPLAEDPDVLPALAAHALAALPHGDRAAAVGWARRAGEQATARCAHEDAARFFGGAVDAARGVLDPAGRLELLLAQAEALARSHDVTAAMAACRAAVDLARHTGDAAALARATLVLPGVSHAAWLDDVRGWCADALAGLPDVDDPLRSRVLAQLAHSAVLVADLPVMARASAAALAMAERLDDPAALGDALRSRQLARAGADGCAERLVLGGRLLAVGERTGDPADTMWGHLWRFDALLQLGRVAEAEVELDRVDPVVARLRRPLARLHLLRGRFAVLFGRGRFAEAAQLNEEALDLARRGGDDGAVGTAHGMRIILACHTGESPGDLSWFHGAPELASPFTALARVAYARLLLGGGDPDGARSWYAGLPAVGSPRIPSFVALPLEAWRAELATDLGDAETAQACHRLLLPHADLHVVGGAGAISTHGSVRGALGVAALGAGRPDTAVRHLEAAAAANDAAGLVPWAAQARHRLAEALRQRGRSGDTDAALAAARAAGEAAGRLGMAPLRAAAAGLAAGLRDGGVLSPRETEIARLVGQGLTNRQIAAAAHISERTVETHVQHVLAKLGFSGRSQIAAWVARHEQ